MTWPPASTAADEGDGDGGSGGGGQGGPTDQGGGGSGDGGRGGEPDDGGADPSDADRGAAAADAEAAYRAYVDAINARDGAALCDLLAPSAIRELRPPVERASCSASLHDSIGYRDPRGFPVWERTLLSQIEGVQISGDLASARITAAINTEFADRGEPSVESDIAYLELAGGEWRLAKPSGALYRAVGNAELPPSVIVPPKG